MDGSCIASHQLCQMVQGKKMLLALVTRFVFWIVYFMR